VRTVQLREEFRLDVRYTVFPLHPETPEDGMELSDLFAGRDLTPIFLRLQQVAAEVGLPLGKRTRTYNSRRLQELGKWAEEQGRGEPFRAAAYHAYFVDGRNIYLPEELAAVAQAADLPAAEAQRVVLDGRYAAAVDADWRRARELGVTAVPTLHYEGRSQVGFAPYAVMRRLITG